MTSFIHDDFLLETETGREIYDACNAQLDDDRFGARGLIEQFNVVVVCTTDDPVDSLHHHLAYRERRTSGPQLRPTWRPDAVLGLGYLDALGAWLDRLEKASNTAVGTYGELLDALDRRHAFFLEAGCRLSDHGLDSMVAEEWNTQDAGRAFDRARRRQPLTPNESRALQGALLTDLARIDHARGWVQQYHIGALRNCNTRLRRAVGADVGCDSIGDERVARGLARHLDRLDQTDQLAKTILYNLNPKDNALFATMAGHFQDGSLPGKLQYGSAWWFLDQLHEMQEQLEALSNLRLLFRFVGMLTDSRSFLSYSRHDYFRRLLCNLLGHDIECGLLPNEPGLLGDLVENVCYEDARRYFDFGLD